MDYQEKYKYITEKLSVLKTEMDDLKKEDRLTRNDVIHDDIVRNGGTKRKLLDQVYLLGTFFSLRETGDIQNYVWLATNIFYFYLEQAWTTQNTNRFLRRTVIVTCTVLHN